MIRHPVTILAKTSAPSLGECSDDVRGHQAHPADEDCGLRRYGGQVARERIRSEEYRLERRCPDGGIVHLPDGYYYVVDGDPVAVAQPYLFSTAFALRDQVYRFRRVEDDTHSP